MRFLKALPGALALSGLMACAHPADQEAKTDPSAPEARSVPEETTDAPPAAEDDQATNETLAAAQQALQNASVWDDKTRQAQTVRDLREIGKAISQWHLDKVHNVGVGAWYLYDKVVDISNYAPISQEDLEKLLVPKYLASLPATDGWGHPYDFRVNLESHTARIYLVRSPGRDGAFSRESYTLATYPADDLDEDLVYVDQTFLFRPEGVSSY